MLCGTLIFIVKGPKNLPIPSRHFVGQVTPLGKPVSFDVNVPAFRRIFVVMCNSQVNLIGKRRMERIVFDVLSALSRPRQAHFWLCERSFAPPPTDVYNEGERNCRLLSEKAKNPASSAARLLSGTSTTHVSGTPFRASGTGQFRNLKEKVRLRDVQGKAMGQGTDWTMRSLVQMQGSVTSNLVS